MQINVFLQFDFSREGQVPPLAPTCGRPWLGRSVPQNFRLYKPPRWPETALPECSKQEYVQPPLRNSPRFLEHLTNIGGLNIPLAPPPTLFHFSSPPLGFGIFMESKLEGAKRPSEERSDRAGRGCGSPLPPQGVSAIFTSKLSDLVNT